MSFSRTWGGQSALTVHRFRICGFDEPWIKNIQKKTLCRCCHVLQSRVRTGNVSERTQWEHQNQTTSLLLVSDLTSAPSRRLHRVLSKGKNATMLQSARRHSGGRWQFLFAHCVAVITAPYVCFLQKHYEVNIIILDLRMRKVRLTAF